MKAISFLIIGLFFFSCHSKKEITESNTPTKWYIEGMNNRTCFPGFMEYDHDIDSAEVLIFNRWGQKIYQSKNMNNNWICNGESSSITQGVYVYQMVFNSNNSMDKDTFRGTITILK